MLMNRILTFTLINFDIIIKEEQSAHIHFTGSNQKSQFLYK